MRIVGNELRLAATDLSNHLACPHLTALDRAAALRLLAPPPPQERAESLALRGQEHERAYLDFLRGQGRQVEVLSADLSSAARVARTLELMQAGVEIIAQGELSLGNFSGKPDVLLRVAAASKLGDFSYEVVDTKLSRQTKAGAVIQLCLYSELLTAVQEKEPEFLQVVPPGVGFVPERYRLAEVMAYFRTVKRSCEDAVTRSFDLAQTYPLPTAHCDVCRWWSECDRRWRADDHPTLVAGLSVLHLRQLAEWNVDTVATVATLADPLPALPYHGAAETYAGLREQARLQVDSRGLAVPLHRLRERQAGKGLFRLPEPCPGDVFLDFEAARFVEPGGMEYLLGWSTRESGQYVYQALWGLERQQEKAAFEAFFDMLSELRDRHPLFHVYHFGDYDLAALKRLATRHATREEELDVLLRQERFVDLLGVIRQGVRIGVESYSLKKIEACAGFTRQTELRAASRGLREIEIALECGQPKDIDPADLAVVEAYNREDCESAGRVRDWLEERRAELVAAGETLERPAIGEGAPTEALGAELQETRALAARLLSGIPDDPAQHGSEQRACVLLAQNLEFHRREDKVNWWEHFRLAGLDDEERLRESKAVAGMVFVETVARSPRGNPTDRYRIPPQEIDLRGEQDAYEAAGRENCLGKVVAINAGGLLDLAKNGKSAGRHPRSIFLFDLVGTKEQKAALLRLGNWVADNGIDSADHEHRAARDLLLGRTPRGISSAQLEAANVDATPAAARALAVQLDHGVLPVQGPPGSGKTYTGARMIVELLSRGRRVGITGTSHKVIRNLMDAVAEAAKKEGRSFRYLQRTDEETLSSDGPIAIAKDNKAVAEALAKRTADLVGGTAWLWSRAELAQQVDVLVIDEAGQVSLANALAVAQAARALILLGDPQQLEQPTKACHPDGSDISALEHLLAGHATMPPDRGLFLRQTRRMHPAITSFTSEQFYEGRLESVPELENLSVAAAGLAGPGLYHLPVQHSGNQSRSLEEVAAIKALVERWLAGGTFTDPHGATKPLRPEDILVVAPYNLQVAALAAALPAGVPVGTVDKFQGQEAPLVVYSMTSSSPEDAPRGLDFLYSRHRLNVATSRAKAACVLVCSPRLLLPDCRTPHQLRLANSLCRYVEKAKRIAV